MIDQQELDMHISQPNKKKNGRHRIFKEIHEEISTENKKAFHFNSIVTIIASCMYNLVTSIDRIVRDSSVGPHFFC